MRDLDAALTLDPGDADTRMARAVLRLGADDRPGAVVDLDAAARALAPQADQTFQLGELYVDADRFEPAVVELSLWLKYHPDDSRMLTALNRRRRARALGGIQLDQALTDCNRLVNLSRGLASQAFDSRGLLRLRRGEYDRARADIASAESLDPKLVAHARKLAFTSDEPPPTAGI